MLRFIKKYAEVFIWSGALVALFFMNPVTDETSLCLFKAMGISWCPGCGLGHAMHYALHLNFSASWNEHILGIPATIILLYQIFKLIYINNKNYKYGSATTF